MADSHIVEMAVDEEHHQKLSSALATITASAIQNHPLMEISRIPGHLLLLKLWQREEHLFGRRIALKESRMYSIKREIFQLYSFFVISHGLFFNILFASSEDGHTCGKWWVPAIVSVWTSVVYVLLAHVKVCRYWKVWKQVQRERNDNRALTRCIQQLRMKGGSFDLSKQPHIGKRMKSSSVEIKWKPLTCCSHYLITLTLACFSALAIPLCHFMLCGS